MPISRDTLNAIRSAISDNVTRHASVKVVLENLSQFENAGDDPKQLRQAWDDTSHDLARLVRDGGILDRKLVDSLANEVVALTSIPKDELQEFKQTAEKFLELGGGDNGVAAMVLPGVPHDLQEGAAAAFTLRALAIHPTRALPPGKSLVSLFMNQTEKIDGKEQKKAKEIADLLKQAFWDSVRFGCCSYDHHSNRFTGSGANIIAISRDPTAAHQSVLSGFIRCITDLYKP
jgi:hypothetical protein